MRSGHHTKVLLWRCSGKITNIKYIKILLIDFKSRFFLNKKKNSDLKQSTCLIQSLLTEYTSKDGAWNNVSVLLSAGVCQSVQPRCLGVVPPKNPEGHPGESASLEFQPWAHQRLQVNGVIVGGGRRLPKWDHVIIPARWTVVKYLFRLSVLMHLFHSKSWTISRLTWWKVK